MKTLVFLTTSFIFLIVAFIVEQNETWEVAAVLIAPIVGILALKLFKFEIIEGPKVELKWIKRAVLLGIIYAFLKLLLKLVAFEHQIEPSSTEFKKFLEHIFMAIVLMPLLEEFFFRGILFDDLKKMFGVAISVLVTSTAFIALHLHHFADGEVITSIIAMLPGIVIYNYLKIRTNNFLVSYAAHLTHNIIGFTFVAVVFRTIT